MKSILFFLFAMSASIAPASAFTFLPENAYRDPTISTVLFEDPYTGFEVRTQGRTVGTVAVSMPAAAWGEHDQLFLQTGVESTLRIEGETFYSETLDLRVGANWVHLLAPDLWLSAGISHTSGHVMDDVNEKILIPYNVGIDGIPLRLSYQACPHLRVGMHELMSIGSDPGTRKFIGGIFFEYFPWSTLNQDGLYFQSDLYLPENPYIPVSTTEQIGYRYHRAHAVAGFHSGADLRLKHQLYLNTRTNFWYTGFKLEI